MSIQTQTRSLKAHGLTLVGVTLASRFAAPILLIGLAMALALINVFLAPGLDGLPNMESVIGP